MSDVLWVQSDLFMEKLKEPGHAATRALDLMMAYCMSGGTVPIGDEAGMLQRLKELFPNRAPNSEQWRKEKVAVSEFFVAVSPERWAPSPKYFVFNNPYDETTS